MDRERLENCRTLIDDVLSKRVRDDNVAAVAGYLTRILNELDAMNNFHDAASRSSFLRVLADLNRGFKEGSISNMNLSIQILNPLIVGALNSPIPPSVSKFSSIVDADLRNILDRDLFEAEDSLKRGRWKPAMVFCGSVLEAVMYDFLRRNPTWTMDAARKSIPKCKGASRDISKDDMENQWSLDQLIEFFCDNQLLDPKPDTWKSTLHNFIRRYRNLVHPMAELRKTANQQVTSERAQQCYANLISVLEVIQKLPTPK